MRILAWHVHGSWMTSFVQGPHDHLIPVVPGRAPDGRGRAETWEWPASAQEVSPEQLRDADIDVVLLQRPEELALTELWTGRRPGTDLPAIYVEHNAPAGPAASTVHPLADRRDIPIVHVTHFNQMMWDCGAAPVTVIEHGIPDPGYLYRGFKPSLGVAVNDPVRRARVAGTDLALRIAAQVDVHYYGMRVNELDGLPRQNRHENPPQQELHRRLAQHRAYLHPYRWTSLGLALIEAMTIGMPVLALSTTEAPRAVPPEAGVLSNDPGELVAAARHWLANPDAAREAGLGARNHARSRYGLDRFLDDWNVFLKGGFDENRFGLRARESAGDDWRR